MYEKPKLKHNTIVEYYHLCNTDSRKLSLDPVVDTAAKSGLEKSLITNKTYRQVSLKPGKDYEKAKSCKNT